MYAIVDIAGQQFKVEEGGKLFVHRLDKKEGDKINIDEVLLIDQDGKVMVGQPLVKGARVTAKVIDHVRGDKVKVFKKKRRKGYQVLNGHRQDFTQIQIETIVEKVAEKKPAAKKETPAKPKAVAKAEDKKPVEKKVVKAKAEVKETKAVKKPAAKKPATKKATTASAKSAATKKPATKKAPAKKTAAKATKKEDKKD